MLDAADEARAQPFDRACQCEVRQAREGRLEHDAQFLSCQPCPEATLKALTGFDYFVQAIEAARRAYV